MSPEAERTGGVRLRRHYAKLCDRRDFEDPQLLDAIRSLVPERDPKQHIERKVWEFAMVMLFLKETGHLDGRSRVLSVGAGDERVLFWLTNHVGQVVATDIYGEGSFAHREAAPSMLEDPAAHAPAYEWRPERLEVHKMDGRALAFPDASFDAVFTVSSIEHFGGPADIARASAEIGRVLKPGGHAIIVTEYLARLHPLDRAPVDAAIRLASAGRRRAGATLRRRVRVEGFTSRQLQDRIIRPSGLRPMQELDTFLSPQSWENVARPTPGGGIETRTGAPYPAILLAIGRSVLASVCIVLVKPTAR